MVMYFFWSVLLSLIVTGFDLTYEQTYSDEDLIWYNPIQPPSEIYKPDQPSPYIVLMECVVKTLNVGKLNSIAIADLIQKAITGKRLIQKAVSIG